MSDRIVVSFRGEGAGPEELSWGQLDLWLAMDRLGTWLPLGYVKPVPEGTTVEAIAAELRFMLERYPSMRTRLRFRTGGGPPQQVVASDGELALEVVEAADGADPAKVAADLQQAYEDAAFDFATDWPVRAAVVRHRGHPTHQVMVMCHLVSDAGGGRVMAADLAGRDPHTGESTAPATGMQPAALARWQRSPAARRQSTAAVRYAEGILRAMPARRFGEPADPRQPRYWQFAFRSRALHLALQAISARSGLDTAPVLLAVYAIALARVSGVNPAVTRLLVGNRFRPELANLVAPISQGGLLLVDVAGITFDEALARTRRRTMSAYKYAYHDPRDMSGLEERVGRQRGEPVDVGCFFNDRRPPPSATGGEVSAPSRAQLRAAQNATAPRCERRQDEALERFFLHVDSTPDTVDLTLLTDTHYVSPADAEAFLRELEAVAVEGALDPTAPTRVPPPESAPAP